MLHIYISGKSWRYRLCPWIAHWHVHVDRWWDALSITFSYFFLSDRIVSIIKSQTRSVHFRQVMELVKLPWNVLIPLTGSCMHVDLWWDAGMITFSYMLECISHRSVHKEASACTEAIAMTLNKETRVHRSNLLYLMSFPFPCTRFLNNRRTTEVLLAGTCIETVTSNRRTFSFGYFFNLHIQSVVICRLLMSERSNHGEYMYFYSPNMYTTI